LAIDEKKRTAPKTETELFEEDDDGYCLVKQAEIPAALQAMAQLAVNNCPEEALSIDA